MTRPLYETLKDKVNEVNFSYDLAQKFGRRFEKLPRVYNLDFCIFKDDTPTGFAELKTRSCSTDEFPTLMISMLKVLAAHRLKEVTGLPSYLFVDWKGDNKRGMVSLNQSFSFSMGGRTDRNDPQDIDITAYIPIKNFNWI